MRAKTERFVFVTIAEFALKVLTFVKFMLLNSVFILNKNLDILKIFLYL